MADNTQAQEIHIGPCMIFSYPDMEKKWTLTFYPSDAQLKEVTEILERNGETQNGYTWNDYIQGSFPKETTQGVDFDPEMSMFSASCDDQEPLIRIAKEIKAMIENPIQLRAEMAQYDQKDEQERLAQEKQEAQQAPPTRQGEILITIDDIRTPTFNPQKPYLIKTLAHNSRSIVTQSRHETEAQALEALETMERNAPGIYTRVVVYRMEKEASAT